MDVAGNLTATVDNTAIRLTGDKAVDTTILSLHEGRKVTEEVISKCHQCGKKSDHHVNCFNNACNLLFIQCKNCQRKMKNCCSKECIDITSLSIEEQKKLTKRNPSKNKIFKI